MNLPETTGEQLRIGVAITVPQPFSATLQAARGRVGDPAAPSIPPHITLLGPTAVEPGDLAAVERHLEEVASHYRPFVLRLRGTGTFRPVSPVVFVQVVEGIAGCQALERHIRTGPLEQDLDVWKSVGAEAFLEPKPNHQGGGAASAGDGDQRAQRMLLK